MDGSDLGSVSDHSIASNGDHSKTTWGLRSCDEKKMRVLESVLHSSEGKEIVSLETWKGHQTKEGWKGIVSLETWKGHQTKEGGTPKTEQTNLSVLSDGLEQVTTDHSSSSSLEQDVLCLSSGNAENIQSPADMDIDAASEYGKQMSELCSSTSLDKESGPQVVTSMGLGVDLNTVDVLNTEEQNPFHSYKSLGRTKPTDASECGSTTGPLEESEPLRMWKKMKQNGFLSSSHGGIPLPKKKGRQFKKRKDDAPKKKIETTRKEQVSKHTKLAAPSGLLSGLDPGIIKHVRNSKQVHSIIQAIVQSEQRDVQIQNRFVSHLARGESRETDDRRKEKTCALGSADEQFALSVDRPLVHSVSGQGRVSTTKCSEQNNDTLELKLSSGISMGSDNASSVSGDDLSENQETITSLSLKAATVASQLLELLQLDIKGRLAALRRSKKRVRNVIQTEMPYLLSTELSSNQDNYPSSGHFSVAGSSKSDVHLARWTSLFSQMDKALSEEGKHLESWLSQVQEMQRHCEKGLKHIGVDGFPQLGPPDVSRSLRKPDEMECAVMAAAASIYSTCNMAMSKENVPCF